MERTDYVAKAKSLMKKAALAIVPLAMAANATAGLGTPTLPSGNQSCSVSGSVFSAGCSMGADPMALSGMVGVKFYTAGWVTLLQSGSGAAGAFSQNISMNTSSVFFNFLPSALPVYYDFSLMDGNTGVTVNDWSLTLSVLGRYTGYFEATGSGLGQFTGSGWVPLTFDSQATDLVLRAYLEVNGTRSSTGGQLSLEVPSAASFDFGSAVTPVPEPATAGIAGVGLALAAWFGQRRRQRRR